MKGNAMTENKKPKCKLVGENGNVFNLMAIASRTLKRHRLADQAEEMVQRIQQEAKSYDEALVLIMEYVDVY